MNKILLQVDEDVIQELDEIKKNQHRPRNTIIREAIFIYLDQIKKRDALSWFIQQHCEKCQNNPRCPVGSLGMMECMFGKLNKNKIK
mgnify:CR=1 FL=1